MEGYMKSPCSSDGKDNPSMLDQVWKDLKMTSWHRSNFSLTQSLKSTLKEEIGCTDEIKHKEGDGQTANKDSFCVWLLVWKIRRLSILRAHYNIMVQPKHCVPVSHRLSDTQWKFLRTLRGDAKMMRFLEWHHCRTCSDMKAIRTSPWRQHGLRKQ